MTSGLNSGYIKSPKTSVVRKRERESEGSSQRERERKSTTE
jgi:hypothetical protein